MKGGFMRIILILFFVASFSYADCTYYENTNYVKAKKMCSISKHDSSWCYTLALQEEGFSRTMEALRAYTKACELNAGCCYYLNIFMSSHGR